MIFSVALGTVAGRLTETAAPLTMVVSLPLSVTIVTSIADEKKQEKDWF